MSRRLVSAVSIVIVAFAAAACETSKSSNPLSPSVAGPIPGVNISAPKALEPGGGQKVAVDQQPLTLMIENASTSGVRPLNYLFEVATDADFTNKVFSRDGISQGDGGRTSLRLPDKLAAERSYYWRARAQDGANTGPYSGASNFNVYTPIVIQQPGLVAPVGNIKVDSVHPRFTWANAPRSGPVGSITYVLEVSDADSFANKIAIWTVGEQSNQTSLDAPQDLGYTKQYFWHVRAYDPTTTGPWSSTQVFQTPDPPVIAPPTPPPGGGDPGNVNGFSFGNVRIVGGSPDVSGWAVTSSITSVAFGGGVFHIDHTRRGQWPAVAFGDTAQESTVWALFNINGVWYASGGERLRPGQTDKELSRPSDLGIGWYYNSLWAPMTNYAPRPGEIVGFLVTAGDTRAGANISVRERSNVVFISFPSDAGGSYPPFASAASLGFIRW